MNYLLEFVRNSFKLITRYESDGRQFHTSVSDEVYYRLINEPYGTFAGFSDDGKHILIKSVAHADLIPVPCTLENFAKYCLR